MKAGERETETMDSQKENRGQKWGWPGMGGKNRDVEVHTEGLREWPPFPFLH